VRLRAERSGNTNKTRPEDYEKAINQNTRALLKVHTSNFKILGFTESVSLKSLAELGAKYHLPVIEDTGSGAIVDLGKYAIADEPCVPDSLGSGAGIISFSGDKLLGGALDGNNTGKVEVYKDLENTSLYRALRLTK
jgi:L-seryl-tRNA(Ser) seleniumtransferase